MPFNKPLPEWKNPGVKPNQGLIDAGWKPDDKPPADVHNWWMNTSYVALEQLQNEAINKDQIGVANGVAPLGDDGKVPASMVSGNTAEIETQLENHIRKDLGHVRYVGGVSGQNALVPVITDVPVVDANVHNPVPQSGYAFRFLKTGANNSSSVVMQINYGNGKNSLAYPLLDSQGKQLTGGALVTNCIYTVAFSGTAFFLQGSGSGVTVTRGFQEFKTPGNTSFVVPAGVSKLTAYIWGAGGGGGCYNATTNRGGGGGGGGSCLVATINVTPNETLSLVVGSGGTGSATVGVDGQSGGYSGVTHGGVNYVAGGGGGGGTATSNNLSGNGGEGGKYNKTFVPPAGVYDSGQDGKFEPFNPSRPSLLIANFGGGDGALYQNSPNGGGGGGSGSDLSGGFKGQQSNGGTYGLVVASYGGGVGGNGGTTTAGAVNGGFPGGGGGGGGFRNGYVGGANGADGRIILFW